MKIVQSFWTKPFLQSADSLVDSRINGGWPQRKHNYYSWALSVLQLRKYYEKVELLTDELGRYILIEKLKLPYTSVLVELNELDHYDAGLWALGKIYAYSRQKEPFLHVDSDVFIWQKFDERIAAADLVAQNREMMNNLYQKALEDIVEKFAYVPPYLREMLRTGQFGCSNAGILGGRDVDFFKQYTFEIFSFVNKNDRSIEEGVKYMSSAYINIVYEQLIFFAMSRIHGREITYLFPDEVENPKCIGQFHGTVKNNGYVHCLGSEKRNRMTYLLLEIKLRSMYPECYNRITELVNTLEI
jgi:hypothetical protein